MGSSLAQPNNLPEPTYTPFRTPLPPLTPLEKGGLGEVSTTRVRGGQEVVVKQSLKADRAYIIEAEAGFTMAADGFPFFPRYVSSGETPEGKPFLMMEKIGGLNIYEVMERLGSIEIPKAIEITMSVLYGLSHLHDVELAHRDLKPQNIMIRWSGEPVIIDLGWVGRFKHVSYAGTPHWRAPEAVAGGFVDGRSDIFSVGILLVYMLTGRSVFQESGYEADAVMFSNLPMINALMADIPRDLSFVIYQMLEYYRADRYPSATEAIEDLRAVQANLS
ncbi:MAG: serine/threonine-protein kinase [bacterium]